MFALLGLAFLAAVNPGALGAPVAGSDVPTGQVITKCTTPNTIALTFDDGPSSYTPQLLDLLSKYNARATFFVLGEASQANPQIIQRIKSEGHQVGSHTYTHTSLPTLSRDQIVQEMSSLESVLQNILGYVPAYMRPPYFDVNDLTLQTMRDLDYHVITASIDTKDYSHNSPDLIDQSFQKFVNELNSGGSISLAHDTKEQTVVYLAQKMLDETKSRGLTVTTVGDCLGEKETLWYRSSK
ncbi:chitin deacetylase [Aspergillus sclerotioniger CBS 115572]|uniref:Chitin deacetylase n=1 Tax=Aspergillus sclerotioniger CBS 115572 TaxID=1450535 RepID=A0A317X613_9EURO|nr:chitin deacetylase [Aspergillus sclerotioniger CBS 115572]PWY92997.1 chitin deacetylase [Aspergillus sclerotioniger CBS 115572]